MKRLNLTAAVLIAAMTLSGCGIYTSAAQSGIPNVPEKNQPNAGASITEQTKPGSSVSTPVAPGVSVKSENITDAVRLTKEQAEDVALKHAGFTADQVKGLKSELDIDGGFVHYEVEFRVGQWDYEYDIHAETGAVLSFEKDN